MNRSGAVHRINVILQFGYCAVLALLFYARADAAGPEYGAPIVLPNAEFAADPTVIRVGDSYYLYPTTTCTNVECWSSADLEAWTYEGVVWEQGPPGSWNDSTIWAPHVLPYEDKFYLYYAANQRIGVAVADGPTGPFVDVYDHPLVGGGWAGTPENSIDADVFRDDDGSLYLYCTGDDPMSVIRVSTMPDPVTVTGDWQILFRPHLIWETWWAEGPWMVKHDGVYYLMYSGSSAMLPFYAVGYASAQNPLGPFTVYAGNPILHVDFAHDFWGPGHNSTVDDAEGRLWIFYHTKVAPDYSWDRVLRKNELSFDADGNMFVVLRDDDTTDDFADDADDDAADDTALADDAADDESGDDDLTDDTADDDVMSDDDSTDVSDNDAGSEGDEKSGKCGC